MGCGVTHLAASEYLLFNDSKFSKSLGIGIFGNQVMDISQRLGIDADYWRYYLLKIRPETSDSNFTYEDFEVVIKGELVSKFGNLVQRVIKLKDQIYKTNCVINYNFGINEENELRLKDLLKVFNEYMISFKNFNYHDVIRTVNNIAEFGNQWLQLDQPWVHTKVDPIGEEWRLGNSMFVVYLLGEVLAPIMPSKSKTILSHINTGAPKNYDEIQQLLLNNNGVLNVNTDGYNSLFKVVELKNLK
jgi:methionyl-tRNA synthetase